MSNFFEWKLTKNQNIKNETIGDGFIKMPCDIGDFVYFGIHDLARNYREKGCLPTLSLYDIFDKKGEIIKIDPVGQTATLLLEKTPFSYGYRKLDASLQDGSKKYLRKDGKIEFKIPVENLKSIVSIMEDDVIPVHLVIDGDTKYQKKLMMALRRKEIERIKKGQQADLPATRHYDDFEGEDFTFEDEDEINESFVENINKFKKWKYYSDNKKYKRYT